MTQAHLPTDLVSRLRRLRGGAKVVGGLAADKIERQHKLLVEWLCAAPEFDMDEWNRRVRDEVEDNG